MSAFLDRVRARAEHRARARWSPATTVSRPRRASRRRRPGSRRSRWRRRARAGLALAPPELSRAGAASVPARRRARSSAASSRWRAASDADGADAVARPLPTEMKRRMGPAHGRRDHRVRARRRWARPRRWTHTARTSPFYDAWIALRRRRSRGRARRDRRARSAGAGRGRRTQRAARCTPPRWRPTPPIIYWNPATLAAIAACVRCATRGRAAFVTIDAGPHVKVLCRAADAETVATALRARPRRQRLFDRRARPRRTRRGGTR